MKIFVTDKYRVITFLSICALVLVTALGTHNTAPVSAPQKRLVPIYSVENSDNYISITFDCAWDAEDIDKIISVLKENKCQATFFVLGTWAQNNPEAIKKLDSAGHEIGNHSFNHTLYTTLSKQQILEDIKKCDDAVKVIINKTPLLFRAPSGDYNNTVVEASEEAGKKYIQWSVDSLDWKELTQEQMLERIVPKTKSGDILLFHNGTPHTAESLDAILKELKKKGFKFKKTSELIYKENYTIDNEGRQHKNTQDVSKE